jgi:predicted amino acid-binding ACT domain protein
MTVEAFTPTPQYTVAGIGPYAITHPYATNAIMAFVVVSGARVQLNNSDFGLTPFESEVSGNLFLTPAAATTHAGRALIIDRMTPDEQGWLATQGERETGLMRQLDRTTQSVQELRGGVEGAIRIRDKLPPFDWADGTVPLRQGRQVVSGPTAAQIAAAQTWAAQALASAIAAAASEASALAKQNSMLRDRGAWVASTLYSPSDIFTFAGSSYITQTSHFATTVAADLAANRIRIFAQQGSAGPGSGDMLKSENLSGLLNLALARTNLGLGALATKALAAFSDLDPTGVISDVEGLFANPAANAVPVAKAVTDAINTLMIVVDQKPASTAGGTFTSAAWRTRVLNTVLHNTIAGGSLAANQITLPVGIYETDISCPALRVEQHRLQNITAGTTLLGGTSEVSEQSGAIVTSHSKITGVITLAATTVLEVQHICAVTKTGDGFGTFNANAPEIYTVAKFRRIG